MAKETQTAQTAASEAIKLDVRAYPIAEPKNKTVAFASVTINDMVAINGIQVIDGKNGLFAQMPQTKVGDEYKDIAFPVTKDLRLQLNKAVVEEYSAEKDRRANEKASVKEQIREGKDTAKESSAKTAPAKASAKDTPSAARGKGSKAKASEPAH